LSKSQKISNILTRATKKANKNTINDTIHSAWWKIVQ